MKRVLILDTETTGLLPKKSDYPKVMPRVLQLALMLDVDGREAALFHTLIKPDGWSIPEESRAIHGISTEMCEATGIPILEALLMLQLFSRRAGCVVAHNYEFDSAVLDYELGLQGLSAEMFSDVRQFCTMKACTEMVGAQGTNSRGSFTKYPRLTEAYTHFTGHPMEADGLAAHSAIGDVQACKVMYAHIQQRLQAKS